MDYPCYFPEHPCMRTCISQNDYTRPKCYNQLVLMYNLQTWRSYIYFKYLPYELSTKTCLQQQSEKNNLIDINEVDICLRLFSFNQDLPPTAIRKITLGIDINAIDILRLALSLQVTKYNIKIFISLWHCTQFSYQYSTEELFYEIKILVLLSTIQNLSVDHLQCLCRLNPDKDLIDNKIWLVDNKIWLTIKYPKTNFVSTKS